MRPRGKALLTSFSTGHTLYTHNQLYGVWRVGKAGAVEGPCPLFPGKSVAANGWCASWVKKA